MIASICANAGPCFYEEGQDIVREMSLRLDHHVWQSETLRGTEEVFNAREMKGKCVSKIDVSTDLCIESRLRTTICSEL